MTEEVAKEKISQIIRYRKKLGLQANETIQATQETANKTGEAQNTNDDEDVPSFESGARNSSRPDSASIPQGIPSPEHHSLPPFQETELFFRRRAACCTWMAFRFQYTAKYVRRSI